MKKEELHPHRYGTRRRRIITATIAIIIIAVAAVSLLRTGYRHYMEAAYPLKYAETVNAMAAEYELPPSLIFAVIRCESGFHEDALSGAGAKGLMQLTDVTYHWTRKKVGNALADAPENVFDPAVNIRCGSYLLRYLRNLFGNDETAIAAYNAGMGRVSGWLKDPAVSADGKHLDSIPYKETANYVQIVTEARKIYQQLYALE